MSTRSAIIQRQDDGSFLGIYCHSDGYPTGVGRTLAEHWQDPEKIGALIALGDISCLGPTTASGGRYDGTFAYMRDRGETGLEAHRGSTWEAVAATIGHNGYVYVHDGQRWTCNGLPLADAIAKDEAGEDVAAS